MLDSPVLLVSFSLMSSHFTSVPNLKLNLLCSLLHSLFSAVQDSNVEISGSQFQVSQASVGLISESYGSKQVL